MLKERLKEVEQNIQNACDRSGRDRSEDTLIAVSKTKPVSMLQEVYEENIRDFGENKVQELCEKMEVLPSDIRWHMIGHLQRNKVKYIVGQVALIHSVDSYRLAEEINIQAKKKNVTVPILVEVNIAHEESKFGVKPEETESFIRELALMDNIRVRGLMTVAPNVENGEENRVYFRNMKQLLVDITAKNINNINMDILSMGMTGDYETAVEEGATIVRVGTGIFGKRDYTK